LLGLVATCSRRTSYLHRHVIRRECSILTVGLMFIALDVPYLLLGPVAGLAVDKYGTKPAAVFGFGYLVPALVLLWLAHASGENQIILYSALLAHYGVGMAVIGSPALSKPQMWFRNMTRRTQVFFRRTRTIYTTVQFQFYVSFFAPDSHRVR
jgi:MFS family permease